MLVLRHIASLSTFPISNSLGVFQKRGEFTLSVLELVSMMGCQSGPSQKRSAKLSKKFTCCVCVACGEPCIFRVPARFGQAVSVGTMEFQARNSGLQGYSGIANDSFGAYAFWIFSLIRSLGLLANYQFETFFFAYWR